MFFAFFLFSLSIFEFMKNNDDIKNWQHFFSFSYQNQNITFHFKRIPYFSQFNLQNNKISLTHSRWRWTGCESSLFARFPAIFHWISRQISPHNLENCWCGFWRNLRCFGFLFTPGAVKLAAVLSVCVGTEFEQFLLCGSRRCQSALEKTTNLY